MGAYGSGRHGWRVKCECLLAIDVREWARHGYLSRPLFSWHWHANDRLVGSAEIRVHKAGIELEFTKAGKRNLQLIGLTFSACHLGGKRPWFVCPSCGGRMAKLYLGGNQVACRQCYGLNYRSQCQGPVDRALDQAEKIRHRLVGKAPTHSGSFPPKPKHMHWRTYFRIRKRHERYEELAEGKFLQLLLGSSSSLFYG